MDSQRLRSLMTKKLDVAESSVHSYILGEHGDSQFPAWSLSHIGGIHLEDFGPQLIPASELEEMAEAAKKKAYSIIEKKGSTYYGIGRRGE